MAPSEETIKAEDKPSLLKRISNGIIWLLETAFYRVGLFVGEYPVLTIVLCLLTCGLCAVGLKTFQETSAQEKLWVPRSSRVLLEKAWVDVEFPSDFRFVTVIVAGRDVLSQTYFRAMMDLYEHSRQITVKGKQLQDLCLKVGGQCRVNSLLELWRYDNHTVRNLRYGDIVDVINNVTHSPMYGEEYDVTTVLGGSVRRDRGDRIYRAEATQMTWILQSGHGLTDAVMAWELEMVEYIRKGHPDIMELYVYASRSFDDEGYGAVNSDTKLLSAGFSLVFVFVMITLGNFNLLEQKIFLSLAGLLSVGLAIIFAYGLATACDVIYGPIQSIMPFLLLGIGVDDMFIIVEAWRNLTPEELKLTLPQRIALTLKHAGVSVTVTSVTDIAAFAIGASTVIPALSAFCIYAALGIFALYVLQSTFFVACLTLDERRRESGRDACVCCYVHRNYTPNACSRMTFQRTFFARYLGPFLMRKYVKVVVVVVAVCMFGLFLWRTVLLRQDFDLTDYIPAASYAHKFARASEKYFPSEGIQTSVYCGAMDYYAQSRRLSGILGEVEVSPYTLNGTLVSWLSAFQQWTQAAGLNMFSEKDFNSNLLQFLGTSGRRLGRFIKLNSTTAPAHIVASYFPLRHTRQPSSQKQIEAMDNLRELLDTAGFPRYRNASLPEFQCFPYSEDYLTNEQNRVLLGEMYRNLGLAAGCVLLVTMLLIANLRTSIFVFICVIFTVVDVAGTLQAWDVSIDTASSILLILCVGLAVDYSAHIGHTFMTVSGSRPDRAVQTLRDIGPAVFNGGFSTLLAFILLANSTSYGFALFFRVFFTVVVYGLFHGLIFLPVLLSWFGPDPYLSSGKDSSPDLELDRVTSDPGGQEEGKENGHLQMNQTAPLPEEECQSVISSEEQAPPPSEDQVSLTPVTHPRGSPIDSSGKAELSADAGPARDRQESSAEVSMDSCSEEGSRNSTSEHGMPKHSLGSEFYTSSEDHSKSNSSIESNGLKETELEHHQQTSKSNPHVGLESHDTRVTPKKTSSNVQEGKKTRPGRNETEREMGEHGTATADDREDASSLESIYSNAGQTEVTAAESEPPPVSLQTLQDPGYAVVAASGPEQSRHSSSAPPHVSPSVDTESVEVTHL